jgi:uncharacterized protein YrrD
MMKRGCEIIGLPVVCLDQGCKTCEIKDLFYCNRNFKVTAFLVQEGGYFHKARVIELEHIKKIGENAVIIENYEKIINVKEDTNKLYSRKKLLGLEVVTSDERNIGIVKDILIEMENGRILGLILTTGLFDDLVEGRSILPIHHELDIYENIIKVNSSVDTSILQGDGGLKKLLSLE